jgi:hypothetical protein
MIAVRLPLLLGTTLIAAAGCAQQPTKPDYTAPAASSAAPPTPTSTAAPAAAAPGAAPIQLASAFPPRLLVFAYEQGWRQVVVSGNNHYFCRGDVPSGSLIASHRCVTQADLETEQLLVQQQQEKLRQPIPYLPKRYP